MTDLPTALYVPDGEGAYRATALTIGPWDPALQHAGPPAALLLREVERTSAIEGQTVRLAYDILGPVPVGPMRVRAHIARGGRRVEMVEATLDAGDDDRPLMRLIAWRMRVRDDGFGTALPAGHGPEGGRGETARFFSERVAYHRSLEWRFVSGSFNEAGPATVWTRPACTLVEGEPITPLQHLLVMTDAASGISHELDWQEFMFVNVDLNLALLRPPRGEWMCMDAVTRLSGTGVGQCLADLYDADGLVGRSTQALLVEPRLSG